MKKFKNKKVLIIAIIAVAVILVIGVVFAFVAGDLFKSNKDRFIDYASQLFEDENGFLDAKLEQYNQKKSSSVYENKGQFTVNIDSDNLDEKTLDNLNNLNISFAGNTDSVNNKAEALIKINYSEDVNFPILFKKADGIYGLKLSEVSKRYFAVDSEKLGGLVSKYVGQEQMNSQLDKAYNAKISNNIDKNIDTITLDITEIISDYYEKKYMSKQEDVKLEDMIFDHTFDLDDDVKFSIEKSETDTSIIGTITLISEEDSSYAAIGTIQESGTIDWDKKYGTYESSDKEDETENNSNYINLDNFELTSEEKNRIKNNLINILKENLENDDFTKVTTSNSEGYSLELNNEKIKVILIKIFEALRDDEPLLNKYNLNKATIQSIINTISSMSVKDGKSNITVYAKDGKLNRIEILFNDAIKLIVSKNSTDDEVDYTISLESQSNTIAFSASFTGLQSLEKVKENYQLSITLGEDGTSYEYNVENEVNFNAEDIDIDSFDENEYIDLTSMDEEKLAKVMELLVKGIKEVNDEQMKKLNIKGENPLISIIPGVSILSSAKNTINDVDYYQSSTTSNTTSNTTGNTTENTTGGSVGVLVPGGSSGSVVDSLEKSEKEVFNAKFTQYEGKNVRGATVKSLLMTVIASNMADEERKIEITGDVVLTGDEVPDSVETSKTYEVKCNIGESGYINKIEILEK